MIVNEYLREHHMLPMDHPIAVENMRRHISPAQKFDNIFSKEELNDIWKKAFSDKRQPRMNRNGTVLVAGALDEIYFEYKERIDKILGKHAEKSPSIGGNYFITPQQYGLHNDSIRPEDFDVHLTTTPMNHERRKYTCWKNFLIPLWIGTHHNEEDGGQIAFFEQRHIDWAHVYNGGGETPNIASVYKISTDYSELQFHNGKGEAIDKLQNKKPFNKDIHKTWMNTPYNRLQGLTVEEVMQWEPGCPMTFDAVQLHNSNEGTKETGKKMWNSKMGLLLTFLIELDEDLLIEWRKEQKKN
tara:strand:+ start:12937 stop:13833 length:897 start_codon:yes stop_codon:yes gene_type:complete